MMMEKESEKYKRVMDILRESKPLLNSTEDIEKEVIRKISGIRKTEEVLSDVIDFLFGWVYIGWVRRSLIAASVILVMVFVWQQGIILKRIDLLSRQTVVVDRGNISTPADEIEKVLTMFKNSGRRFPSRTIEISDNQIRELLDSIRDLQIKYKDLENLIEEDPGLKKYIEEKLSENNRTGNKL
jgi:hypothetical protein